MGFGNPAYDLPEIHNLVQRKELELHARERIYNAPDIPFCTSQTSICKNRIVETATRATEAAAGAADAPMRFSGEPEGAAKLVSALTMDFMKMK
ncbi:MAG: hypothetical protein EHM28_06680 [Spirochaetaceae bacterium]|nr:MAG: hypothetical protein EHM28_06680 [Spirochaetaceae bacterium]